MATEDQHAKLRDERRALEVELQSIDDKIRDAINAGDLKALDTLTERKAELPKLFIAASTAETTARHALFNAEDEVNMKHLAAAEAERDKARARLIRRQQEVEIELAAIKTKLEESEQKVTTLYTAINGSRDLGASGDAGFKRSLAALGH